MPNLLEPLRVGAWELPNRIIMAPLTRCRAKEGRVPTELMAQYYRQRASAGLIIAEATAVTQMGVGYPDTPGIWSQEQVAGWRGVTDAVHEAGGRIVLQLWHVGRISDPYFLGGQLPVAPSAIAASGQVSLVRPKRDFVVPRALDRREIPEVVDAYQRGAENAERAGFDGVELHGANGYLLHQFLNAGSNTRTDDYGGSIENRARLMLEVIDAAISVWGADRVGLHLSPSDSEPLMNLHRSVETYEYVMQQATGRNLAFVCVREPIDDPLRCGPRLRAAFGGAYIANDGFDQASGEAALARGEADAVAYGRWFISNPDLPRRFAEGKPLAPFDPATFYSRPLDLGYTDYPSLD